MSIGMPRYFKLQTALFGYRQPPNPPLERDRLPALPAGTLRGFAAPAAPQLAR